MLLATCGEKGTAASKWTGRRGQEEVEEEEEEEERSASLRPVPRSRPWASSWWFLRLQPPKIASVGELDSLASIRQVRK